MQVGAVGTEEQAVRRPTSNDTMAMDAVVSIVNWPPTGLDRRHANVARAFSNAREQEKLIDDCDAARVFSETMAQSGEMKMMEKRRHSFDVDGCQTVVLPSQPMLL